MPNEPTQHDPNRPGRGLLGWLGRQIGYVRVAVHADSESKSESTHLPQQRFERRQVDEAPHPTDARITLRRTTIDEAILDRTIDPTVDREARDPASDM